jgi:hypothetical protein
MSTLNPFDGPIHAVVDPGTGELAGVGTQGGSPTPAPPNPFDMIIPEYGAEIDSPSKMGTFFKGVGSGLLHPIGSFIDEEETAAPEGWTLGHTVANFAGELAGVGIGFIPFLKGTQLALKGLGFGARTVGGAFVRTPGFALMEGAVSGAAFEIGSDSADTVAERLALGAGLGVGAEAVLLTVSRGWRAGWHTTRGLNKTPETRPHRLLPSGPTTRVPGMEYSVNPNAVAMEMNLHPEGAKTFEEAIKRFRLIETHGEQLNDAAARVAMQFRPFGLGILTGIASPGQTMRALRKQMPWGDVDLILRAVEPTRSGAARIPGAAWDATAEGKPMYEILMVDRKLRSDLELLDMGEDQLIETFMGGGPLPSYENVLKIVRGPVASSEMAGPVKVVEASPAEMGAAGLSHAAGAYSRGTKTIIMLQGQPAEEMVATLVHEYAHHFSYARAFKEQGDFNIHLPTVVLGKDWAKSADQFLPARLIEQGEEMTIQTLMWQHNTTRKGAQGIVNTQPSYYKNHNELISRAFELMLVKPDVAKQLAPDLTHHLAELIHRESPKLKSMLTKTELKRMHAILEGLWKVTDRGESLVFHKTAFQFSQKMAWEFEQFGAFTGMSVRFEGEEWVVDGIGQGGRVFNIRQPMTGATKEVPTHQVHRPLMAQVAEKNRTIKGRIKELLSKPAKWLGVTIREGSITNPDGSVSHGVRRAIVELEDYERATTLTKWMDENRGIHQKLLQEATEQGLGPADLTPDMILKRMLEVKGKKGIVFNDMGRHILFVGDDASIQRSSETIADAWVRGVDGETSLIDGARIDRMEWGRALLDLDAQNPIAGTVNEAMYRSWIEQNAPHMLKDADETVAQSGIGYREWMEVEIQESRHAKPIYTPWAGPWLQPSQENVMESILREAGVSERELDYFRSTNPFEDEALNVASEEGLLGRIMEGLREVNTANVAEPLTTTAARSGLRLDRTTDWDYRLLTPTGEEVLRTGDPEEVTSFLNKMGPDTNAPDLEQGATIQSSAMPHAHGGSVTPPKPFQQVLNDPDFGKGKVSRFLSRFLDSTQLFLATFTAMENIAKSGERRGFGPLFTRIFHPVQEALERVDNAMAGIKRDDLGGRTFSEQLKLIEQLSEGPLFGKQWKERSELSIRAMEAMSKEEIARPGGLLVRGLSDVEIKLADTISNIGMQDDIPRLTGILRMAKLAVEQKGSFPKKLMEMKRVEVNPEFRKALDQMEMMLESMPDTLEGIFKEMGLSNTERLALGIIDEVLKKGVDDQSLFAISRYAAAKPLGRGYKTARDEFMDLNGFTAKERKLVEELERTYKAAFQLSNLHSKKEIGGYWPHMRKWIEAGFSPDEEFIRKHIPESVEWSAERVRTGELDVYLMDPVRTTAKYIRGMLMKQEFDPILPDVKEAVANLGVRDERLHRIFAEYVHEAMGRPHASFRQLHQVISTSTKILTGRTPDERFTRDIINSLGSLANAAAIPFRPMLILRNYFQMTQMIPPRTGVGEYFDGLRMAISDEGFKEAVEKGIVTKNVLPVHAATEVYGYDTSRLNRRLQRVFQKGFEWYQKPDDIGRAAAFFSAKARINKHTGDFFSGKITYAQFKQRAKLNTYDSVDIQKFDEMWENGRYEEAKDYIGSRLARETIFRYGHANHPAGWGSVAGRLYGTFGTWPTQYKDFLLQGMSRGSTRDRLEFLATHGAVNAATLAAGAAVGVDLMSWVAYPSLNYTGGPFADLTINVVQAFGGSPTEQSLAKRNIRMMFPSLEDPRSIFVPGSYFIGDLYRAGTAQDMEESVIGGLGIRMLTKDSKNPFAGVWD